MQLELKRYIFVCDQCRTKSGAQEVTSAHQVRFPAGWIKMEVHDCGMTGYTKTVQLCEKCAEN